MDRDQNDRERDAAASTAKAPVSEAREEEAKRLQDDCQRRRQANAFKSDQTARHPEKRGKKPANSLRPPETAKPADERELALVPRRLTPTFGWRPL